jgi:3-phenylpropionate/cinnamic acid dioxygenase small subunit
MSGSQLKPVDAGTYVEIQRFIFREAALLDRREYFRWIALTTADIQYRVTAAVAREAGAASVDTDIIHADAVALKARIDQISNPKLTRAENPPSLLRRAVTNIEAYHGERQGEIIVTSYLLAYRSRPDTPQGGFYVAEREDTLRKEGDEWRLARRTVRLDQIMLFDGALSTLL